MRAFCLASAMMHYMVQGVFHSKKKAHMIAGGIGPMLIQFAESIPEFYNNIKGWRDTGEIACNNWQGVGCDLINQTQTVTTINLSSLDLTGATCNVSPVLADAWPLLLCSFCRGRRSIGPQELIVQVP